MSNVHLFKPLHLRSVVLPNRIGMSPMAQYSSTDGFISDWHPLHYGTRAVGGVGLIIIEATAIEPRGRITPGDLGLWDDKQVEPLARVVKLISMNGAVPGIQLAHAGRKASTAIPWNGDGQLTPDEGGWLCVAPSPLPYDTGYLQPHQLTEGELIELVDAWANAARRALDAGIKVIDIHSAHGYLLHEFLSPLSNHRTDQYGGTLENRMRFPLMVVDAVRKVIPDDLPLFVRISATDWADGGWNVEEAVVFAGKLKEAGVDLIDTSSAGLVPKAKIIAGPGFQVQFADRIRREAQILTSAVGLITTAEQVEEILANGKADLVLLGRELLRTPYWMLNAAKQFGVTAAYPNQYVRAK